MKPRDTINKRMTLRLSAKNMTIVHIRHDETGAPLNWIVNKLIEKGMKYEKEIEKKI